MKDLITGIVQQADGQKLNFVAEEDSYRFCFMSTNTDAEARKNEMQEIPNIEGFIYGKTHGNRSIAISAGEHQIKVGSYKYLHTSAYVTGTSNVYEEDISTFDAICFQGNTLNQLFWANAMRFDYEDEKTVVNYKNDGLNYSVQTLKYNMELHIYSVVSEGMGLQGSYIKNDGVVLELRFDRPQPLKTIFEHYMKIKDLLSFMTFRKNVGFEEIYLVKKDGYFKGWSKCANVYIKDTYGEYTKKKQFSNICFEDLGDALPNLLKLLYDTEDKKPSYSIGFCPENDKDISWMNDYKVREICSALECELSLDEDIKVEGNELLELLVKETRSFVKDFRKKHPGLDNDTYNGVFSDMKRWSLPAAEKIYGLYEKYSYEMLQLYRTSFQIRESNIKDFVKYRNDITHGSHRVMEGEITETAYYLMGLVYCSILTRIGISREKLLELCKQKILS